MLKPIDFTNLQKMIDEKVISVQKHPTLDLFIYNYTQRAQFDRIWNNETLQCRGLIMNSKNEIVARPFPKFFNLSEALEKGEQLPAEDFVVTEKMDGSLGVLYWGSSAPCLATRRSFTSEQAIKGTEILHNIYANHATLGLSEAYTYLFEIIYPQNRIVVNYGDIEDIVLLSIIDTKTGKELSYDKLKEMEHYFTIVNKYDAIRDFTKIEAEPNKEGYVITFLSGKRFKIKFDEYVRLHRLVTGVNSKNIWELLRDNKPIDELLDRVPDEFYKWVKDTKEKLEADFAKWENTARQVYSRAIQMETRKEQAQFIKDFNCRGIVFAMLDNKNYKDMIWKMVKPKAERPFKEDIEA